MVTGNNSAVLRYSDDSLRKEARKDCHLSILLDSDAIAWAVTEKATELVREVGTYPSSNDLTEMLAGILEIADMNYASASLALRSMPVALVPKSLDRESREDTFLAFQGKGREGKVLRHDIPAIRATALFQADEEALAFLQERHPNISIHSNAGLLIHSALGKGKQHHKTQVYADLSARFVEVLIVAQKQVLLYNTFPIDSDEDALYHLNNSLQQLGLDPAESILHLSGDIALGSDRFKHFAQYHPEIRIHFGFSMPQLALPIGRVNKQSYMALLNQFKCVL